LEKDENTDDDEAERTNLGKNLLQVASGVVVCTDKGSGTTEERIGTS